MTIEDVKHLLIIFLAAGYIFCPNSCHAIDPNQDESLVTQKTTPVIASLLASKDYTQYAKVNKIELKDDMVKVVIIVNEELLPRDFVSKYDLKEFKIRKNTANAYIKLDALKKICEEPGVIFVRLPFKLRTLFK
ncbi:MAG: hypothetical protein Q8R38_04615 [Candidatus Omnitrophota bacterium]|nr:hypothetical protein [Candidatus Omnitrophota bacterium]